MVRFSEVVSRQQGFEPLGEHHVSIVRLNLLGDQFHVAVTLQPVSKAGADGHLITNVCLKYTPEQFRHVRHSHANCRVIDELHSGDGSVVYQIAQFWAECRNHDSEARDEQGKCIAGVCAVRSGAACVETSLSGGANVDGSLDAATEPMRWSSACLRDDYEVRYRRNLDALGYRGVPMRGTRSDALNAVCHLRGLFSDEAVAALREIGRALERSASSSNWIISKRVRAVTERSRFIDDMMHDRAFLLRVSRLAGVPLIPYPMVNARSQFNYYYPTSQRDGKEQLGMWHTDGTSFVLNIVLSDRSDYEGGNFLFYESTAETFDRHDRERRHVKTANLDNAGDALLIYGSKLFHGVEPVESGRRMSLVLSFHCPTTREDDNGFWHLASDDGIPRTVVNWLALQRALRDDAELQYHRLETEPIRPGIWQTRACPRQPSEPSPHAAIPAPVRFRVVVEFRLHRRQARRGETAGAFNLLFWRFLLVTLCLAIVLNRQLARLTWEKLRYHAVIGFLSQFLYLACVYVAIQHGLPPGIAAIVAAMQPLITAAMTSLEGSERSGARQWAETVVGFVGVGIVIGGQYALPAGSVGSRDVPAAAGVRAGAVDRDDLSAAPRADGRAQQRGQVVPAAVRAGLREPRAVRGMRDRHP